jgi:tetratricopeptide (TPR) repeat protein
MNKQQSEDEAESVVRINRLRHLAEHQFEEALRIDPTRADLLAEYASYLSRSPGHYEEALKYFNLALQANPFNQVLQKKRRAFIALGSERGNDKRPPHKASFSLFGKLRSLHVEHNTEEAGGEEGTSGEAEGNRHPTPIKQPSRGILTASRKLLRISKNNRK